MYHTAVVLVTALTLVMAPSLGAQAQPKQKDPVLQRYLLEEFAPLNAKLGQLNERVAATATKFGPARAQAEQPGRRTAQRAKRFPIH